MLRIPSGGNETTICFQLHGCHVHIQGGSHTTSEEMVVVMGLCFVSAVPGLLFPPSSPEDQLSTKITNLVSSPVTAVASPALALALSKPSPSHHSTPRPTERYTRPGVGYPVILDAGSGARTLLCHCCAYHARRRSDSYRTSALSLSIWLRGHRKSQHDTIWAQWTLPLSLWVASIDLICTAWS